MRDGTGLPPLTAMMIMLGASAQALLLPWVPSSRALMLSLDDLLIAALTPAEPQHRGVALVAIDEGTLAAATCRSPIDRLLLAALVEQLDAAGVRAIGLDVLLDQPTTPEADGRLAQVLRQARAPVSPSQPRPARSWVSGNVPGTPPTSRACRQGS